jgi:hypothetical protein
MSWFDKFFENKRLLEEERKKNEKRPVKWLQEGHNVWRVVYADEKD